jgi:hypothetical protein
MKLGIYLEEHKPGLHPKRPAEIGWLGALSAVMTRYGALQLIANFIGSAAAGYKERCS